MKKYNSRKTVLVTGGTRGLGKVIAEHFLEHNFNVIICSSNSNSCSNAEKTLVKYSNFIVLRADVAKEKEVIDLIQRAKNKFNKIDILINNAGIHTPIGKFFNNDTNDWEKTIAVNLLGSFYTCKHLVPEMIRNNFGRIINISGGGATKPMPNFSAYSASKAGLVRFTETIAEELEEYNIKVNVVAPGFLATSIHESSINTGPEILGDYYWFTKKKIEEGGESPKKTAELVFHLSSEKCNINGKLISAIHDNWEEIIFSEQLSKNMFTLRRVDNYSVFEKITHESKEN